MPFNGAFAATVFLDGDFYGDCRLGSASLNH